MEDRAPIALTPADDQGNEGRPAISLPKASHDGRPSPATAIEAALLILWAAHVLLYVFLEPLWQHYNDQVTRLYEPRPPELGQKQPHLYDTQHITPHASVLRRAWRARLIQPSTATR